jgi:DNA repair exonuclease SbcCD ATPase subunit
VGAELEALFGEAWERLPEETRRRLVKSRLNALAEKALEGAVRKVMKDYGVDPDAPSKVEGKVRELERRKRDVEGRLRLLEFESWQGNAGELETLREQLKRLGEVLELYRGAHAALYAAVAELKRAAAKETELLDRKPADARGQGEEVC